MNPTAILDGPWALRDFGAGPMLVTKHGGSKVVLVGRSKGLTTSDASGRLEPLTAENPLAHLLVAAPLMRDALVLVEWSGNAEADKCPCCEARKSMLAHFSGCALREALDVALNVQSDQLVGSPERGE